MLGALVSYPVLVLCFVSATKWTTAANAIALQSTSPAWMFVFSAIALRQLPLRLLTPILVILGGILVVLLEPATGISAKGNLVALVAGVSWATFAFSYARIRTPGPGVISLCNLVTFAALLLLQPVEVLSTVAPAGGIRLVDWLMLIYLGVVQQGVAFMFFTAAMRRLSPTQVMVLVLLEPLLNPVWVYFVVGEAPSVYGLSGGGLILLGILIDIFIRRDPREAMRDAIPRVLPED
jgi:drug/metabolite transporter (DMT)-like permease